MFDGLAGIYDARVPLDAERAAALMTRAVNPGGTADAIAVGALAAARHPAGAHSGEAMHCLLVGRVYNAGELAVELGLPAGTPAERVAAMGYQRAGTSWIARLDGAFVILLWDVTRNTGVIAADQLGTRSLYYQSDGTRLVFGSDIRLILRLLPVRPQPDEVSLVHLVANSAPPGMRTMFEGVQRVGAGHCLLLEDGRWNRHRYWTPQYSGTQRRPRAEVVEELWAAVANAVRTRTSDTREVGIVMSGGVDSSIVAAAATSAADGDATVRGYSAVFPGEEMDESERINRLSSALGLASTQFAYDPGGAFALSLEYLDTWGLPLTGVGYLLERPLLDQARLDGVEVVLDGQGGDEVFGLSPLLLADRIRQGRLASSLRLARAFPTAVERAPWRHTAHLWRYFGLKHAAPYRLHEAARRRRGALHYAPRWLSEGAARTLFDTDDQWDWKRSGDAPLWWKFKAKLITHDREHIGLANYVRHRAAMSGLEARPPLMDVDLVEIALTVPPDMDFDARMDRPLIREALRGRIPDEVRLWRSKSNVGPFYHSTLAGRDLPAIRRLLGRDRLEIERYVHRVVLDNLLESPASIGEPGWLGWLPPVWRAAIAECWLREQSDPGFAARLREHDDIANPRWRVHARPPNAP